MFAYRQARVSAANVESAIEYLAHKRKAPGEIAHEFAHQNFDLINNYAPFRQTLEQFKTDQMIWNKSQTHLDRIKSDAQMESKINDTQVLTTLRFSENELWLKQTFGDDQKKINEFYQFNLESVLDHLNLTTQDVVYATVHYDQTVPHLHVVLSNLKTKYSQEMKRNYISNDVHRTNLLQLNNTWKQKLISQKMKDSDNTHSLIWHNNHINKAAQLQFRIIKKYETNYGITNGMLNPFITSEWEEIRIADLRGFEFHHGIKYSPEQLDLKKTIDLEIKKQLSNKKFVDKLYQQYRTETRGVLTRQRWQWNKEWEIKKSIMKDSPLSPLAKKNLYLREKDLVFHSQKISLMTLLPGMYKETHHKNNITKDNFFDHRINAGKAYNVILKLVYQRNYDISMTLRYKLKEKISLTSYEEMVKDRPIKYTLPDFLNDFYKGTLELFPLIEPPKHEFLHHDLDQKLAKLEIQDPQTHQFSSHEFEQKMTQELGNPQTDSLDIANVKFTNEIISSLNEGIQNRKQYIHDLYELLPSAIQHEQNILLDFKSQNYVEPADFPELHKAMNLDLYHNIQLDYSMDIVQTKSISQGKEFTIKKQLPQLEPFEISRNVRDMSCELGHSYVNNIRNNSINIGNDSYLRATKLYLEGNIFDANNLIQQFGISKSLVQRLANDIKNNGMSFEQSLSTIQLRMLRDAPNDLRRQRIQSLSKTIDPHAPKIDLDLYGH